MGTITTFPITTKKISELTALTGGGVDQTNDIIEITDVSATSSKKITVLNMLNITGVPLGTTDAQVVSNKTIGITNTITAATGTFQLEDTTFTSFTKFALGESHGATQTVTIPGGNFTIVGVDTVQTLTNKGLTSPAITGGTIDNSTVTVDAIAGHTTSNTGTIYGISITAGVINSVLTMPIGTLQQVVSTLSNAVATGSNTIPFDDTIPQSTEGDQYMSLAITPKSATNSLVIQVNASLANSTASKMMIGGLFQDSTANALSVNSFYVSAAGATTFLCLQHTMTAGTTSSTTFKFRAGEETGGGTTTINGAGGVRRFGGVASVSSIVIWEYKS